MLYAKLQSYIGEEYHLKEMPIQLSNYPSVKGVRVMKCINNPLSIGEIKINGDQYSFIPYTQVFIEN